MCSNGVLEEVGGRPRPQLRVWVPELARYRRMSLDLEFRDAEGRRDPARIAQALAKADDVVRTVRARVPALLIGPATVRQTLAYSLDDVTGKKHGSRSDQKQEWARASLELQAVLDPDLPLSQLRAVEIIGVAQSALARVALCKLSHAATTKEWAGAITQASRELPGNARNALVVIVRAFTNTMAAQRALIAQGLLPPRATPTEAVTTAWAWRTAHLVRGIVRHAAGRGDARFVAGDGWTLPKDLRNESNDAAAALKMRLESQSFRPAHSEFDTRRVLLHLRDPRYAMAAALATVVNGDGALRLPRTMLGLRGEYNVDVRKNTQSTRTPQLTWHALPPAVALVVRSLMATEFADVEAVFAETGEDYRLIADTQWEDGVIQRTTEPTIIKRRVAVQLVDPRAHQLLDLGAEGRAGQVVRCWRSDLKIDGTTGAMVLDIRGAGKSWVASQCWRPCSKRSWR